MSVNIPSGVGVEPMMMNIRNNEMTGANGVEFSNNNYYINHRSQTLGLGAVDPLKVDLPYYSESTSIS